MHPLVLLLLLAAAPKPPPDVKSPEHLAEARARAALGPFKKGLKEALTEALAKAPDSAIDVCAKQAPQLAKDASTDGVVVGRSALKLRNPANAPAAWLEPVMKELAKAPRGSPASKLVKLPGGKHGFAEAIWVSEQCLMCHGKVIAPALDEKLKQRYPKDAARGFELGDFRGVFWAEVTD